MSYGDCPITGRPRAGERAERDDSAIETSRDVWHTAGTLSGAAAPSISRLVSMAEASSQSTPTSCVATVNGQSVWAWVAAPWRVINTYKYMLPKSISQKLNLENTLLQKVKSGHGALSIFVGLKGSNEELGLNMLNYIF